MVDTTAERLARIEEGIKGVHRKVDGLLVAQQTAENTLTRHAVEIAIIKSRGSTWKTVLAVASVLVAATGGILVLLNQLYVA